jgi:hypothetical protein
MLQTPGTDGVRITIILQEVIFVTILVTEVLRLKLGATYIRMSEVKRLNQIYLSVILETGGAVDGCAAACHAGGPGSIPGPGQTYLKSGKGGSFLYPCVMGHVFKHCN